MQEKVKEALGQALEAQVAQHVKSALTQSWAPEEPLPEQLSPWMEQLLGTLEVRTPVPRARGVCVSFGPVHPLQLGAM